MLSVRLQADSASAESRDAEEQKAESERERVFNKADFRSAAACTMLNSLI